MKIVAISDTHQREVELPWAHVLVHAGDACEVGSLDELDRFVAWFGSHPHPVKILVAGNHDWPFQVARKQAEEILKSSPSQITYLEDTGVRVNNKTFYGSPWQPEFCHWAFNLSGPDLKPKWDRIPIGLDVLITHGPPYGIGDLSSWDNRIGCRHLRERLKQVCPRYHVFGHNHAGYGSYRLGSTNCFNVSTCNERYEAKNPAVEFEI